MASSSTWESFRTAPSAPYLQCRVHLDQPRLLALWPDLDLQLIRSHVEAFPKIRGGDPAAGPIAKLSRRERFHWLVAPRSTMIQVSAVHSGLRHSPESVVEELLRRLVLM